MAAFHIRKIYILLAVVVLSCGIILSTKMVALGGRDEFTHFARAYQISEGQLNIQKLPGNMYGGYLPSNIAGMIDDLRSGVQASDINDYRNQVKSARQRYMHIQDVGHDNIKEEFASAGPYIPVGYIPSILGIWLGRILHVPLIWYVYLARIFSFATWLILTILAVRLLPVGKVFLVLLALLPVTLVQAVTLSPDGLLISASWLLIAVVLRVCTQESEATKRQQFTILGLAVLVAIIKQGYWFIALLPILIPNSKFINPRSAWKRKGLIIGLVLLSAVCCYAYGKQVAAVLPSVFRPTLNIDVSVQTSWIMHHPLEYMLRLVRQLWNKEYAQVYTGLVGELTNRAVQLPFHIVKLLYIALIAGLIITPYSKSLSNQKLRLGIGAGVVAIATYVLINTALYLSFTPIGEPWVQGMQGRYFLPFLPLLVLLPAFIKYPRSVWGVRSLTTLAFVSITVSWIYTLRIIS